MRDTMTFGECLSALMREKNLSVAELTRRMGYRSKTSVVRLLRDEVRYASIEDFMNRLEQLDEWTADGEEIKALRHAMEVSRLGRERYMKHREMWRLTSQPETARQEVRLESFGRSAVRTIHELALEWREAKKLRFLMINSGFESLFRELGELMSARPGLDAEIEHYLIMKNEPGSVAEQLGAILSVFHDPRYRGYYRTWDVGGSVTCVGYGLNSHAVLVCGTDREGNAFSQMLTMLTGDSALLYETDREDFGDYIRRTVADFCGGALPLKTQYPEQDVLEGLIAVCRKYLECEQDRATCCMAPNICFELIPYEILYEVMFDSVVKGADPNDAQILELSRLQKARCANIYGKKKQTVFIFDWESLKQFAQTGRTTDHVIGMRPFTPTERRMILREVAEKARGSEWLKVYVLKPEVQPRGMTLTAYEGLGVYLLDAFTQYDLANGHSEAFLFMPDFAAALERFFKDELIGKCCHCKETSLKMLEKLADELE